MRNNFFKQRFQKPSLIDTAFLEQSPRNILSSQLPGRKDMRNQVTENYQIQQISNLVSQNSSHENNPNYAKQHGILLFWNILQRLLLRNYIVCFNAIHKIQELPKSNNEPQQIHHNFNFNENLPNLLTNIQSQTILVNQFIENQSQDKSDKKLDATPPKRYERCNNRILKEQKILYQQKNNQLSRQVGFKSLQTLKINSSQKNGNINYFPLSTSLRKIQFQQRKHLLRHLYKKINQNGEENSYQKLNCTSFYDDDFRKGKNLKGSNEYITCKIDKIEKLLQNIKNQKSRGKPAAIKSKVTVNIKRKQDKKYQKSINTPKIEKTALKLLVDQVRYLKQDLSEVKKLNEQAYKYSLSKQKRKRQTQLNSVQKNSKINKNKSINQRKNPLAQKYPKNQNRINEIYRQITRQNNNQKIYDNLRYEESQLIIGKIPNLRSFISEDTQNKIPPLPSYESDLIKDEQKKNHKKQPSIQQKIQENNRKQAMAKLGHKRNKLGGIQEQQEEKCSNDNAIIKHNVTPADSDCELESYNVFKSDKSQLEKYNPHNWDLNNPLKVEIQNHEHFIKPKTKIFQYDKNQIDNSQSLVGLTALDIYSQTLINKKPVDSERSIKLEYSESVSNYVNNKDTANMGKFFDDQKTVKSYNIQTLKQINMGSNREQQQLNNTDFYYTSQRSHKNNQGIKNQDYELTGSIQASMPRYTHIPHSQTYNMQRLGIYSEALIRQNQQPKKLSRYEQCLLNIQNSPHNRNLIPDILDK